MNKPRQAFKSAPRYDPPEFGLEYLTFDVNGHTLEVAHYAEGSRAVFVLHSESAMLIEPIRLGQVRISLIKK